jgi:hypothetical protein
LEIPKTKEWSAEARLVSFLIEKDLPYSLSKGLLKLLKSIPGLRLLNHARLSKTKAASIVQHSLTPNFHEKLLNNLKTNLSSVDIDNKTDQAVAKQLSVCVYTCDVIMDLQVNLVALRV